VSGALRVVMCAGFAASLLLAGCAEESTPPASGNEASLLACRQSLVWVYRIDYWNRQLGLNGEWEALSESERLASLHFAAANGTAIGAASQDCEGAGLPREAITDAILWFRDERERTPWHPNRLAYEEVLLSTRP